MRTLRVAVVAFVCCAGLLAASSSWTAARIRASSAPGWLLLEGGGNFAGTDIAKRFVALAGGPNRTFVVISTAISDTEVTANRRARCASRSAQILQVAQVTCLDAKDRTEANSAAIIDVLRKADGVWIYGGDEERLVDRYVGTAVVEALRAVLDRGGVVGGTSAGAMILASYV
ncbi:MAG TPA: Type 1 glutamine amidotransferase-like domain-containing protein, partial [Gemmatimonadaceae bacterium]|nr:Type 1 glutamine amidotransferase-like domain-containing protein [Gemmatimonadaceae bacterium]